MASKQSLGDRMKSYEGVFRGKLIPRSPVIIRIDGRAFHTWTKQFKAQKPFDHRVISAMEFAACKVAEEMQGFKLGYVQSDEASFLITDFDDVNTQGWFDYVHSKIVSISASVMTYWFNKYVNEMSSSYHFTPCPPAFFDSRAFVVPVFDVSNYFLWRAKDWERNSVQMLSRAHFSHKALNGKKQADMHEMLHEKGINWATDCSEQEKNGTWIINNPLTGKIETRFDILPSYVSIEPVVSGLIFKNEEEQNDDEISGRPSCGASSSS